MALRIAWTQMMAMPMAEVEEACTATQSSEAVFVDVATAETEAVAKSRLQMKLDTGLLRFDLNSPFSEFTT